jgi:hypothetical protein
MRDKDDSKYEPATLAAGCFWGVESIFKQVKGVVAQRLCLTKSCFLYSGERTIRLLPIARDRTWALNTVLRSSTMTKFRGGLQRSPKRTLTTQVSIQIKP